MLANIVLTAVGLGLAGIDPAGAILGMGLFGVGTPRRNVFVMIAIYFLGTILLGTMLSTVFAGRVDSFDFTALEPPDWVDAIVFAVVGFGLLAWGALRLLHSAPPSPGGPRRGTGLRALAILGVFLAVGSLFSPPFLALVVIAGGYHRIWAIVLAHTIWIVINQFPLLLVILVELTGHGDRAVAAFHDWWVSAQPAIARLFSGALAVVGVAFLIESSWWLAARSFLLI